VFEKAWKRTCHTGYAQVHRRVMREFHGYGTDYGGCADCAWAHAAIARDNIAMALADMVEIEYLGLDEAKEVARAWLFDNANEFYRLGLNRNRDEGAACLFQSKRKEIGDEKTL